MPPSPVDIAAAFTLIVALGAMLLPLLVPLSVVAGSVVAFALGVALFALYCFVRQTTIANLLMFTAMASVATGFAYALTTAACGDLVSILFVPVLSLAAVTAVIPPLAAL